MFLPLRTCLCLALAILPACSAPSSKSGMPSSREIVVDEDPTSDQTAVRVQAFRQLLRKHPAETLAFLSYGQGNLGSWSSAGPVVMSQLADLHLKLLPAAQANVPALGAGGPTLHRKTGELGILYTVVITRWPDIDTAEVTAQRYDGRIPISGFVATIHRIPGNLWRIDQYHPW